MPLTRGGSQGADVRGLCNAHRCASKLVGVFRGPDRGCVSIFGFDRGVVSAAFVPALPGSIHCGWLEKSHDPEDRWAEVEEQTAPTLSFGAA